MTKRETSQSVLILLTSEGKEGEDLQSHGIKDDLQGEVLAIGGDTVLEDWAGIVVLAVLVDQVPEDVVEDGSPDGADSMDLVLLVGINILEGVGGQVGGVWVLANAGAVVDPTAL